MEKNCINLTVLYFFFSRFIADYRVTVKAYQMQSTWKGAGEKSHRIKKKLRISTAIGYWMRQNFAVRAFIKKEKKHTTIIYTQTMFNVKTICRPMKITSDWTKCTTTQRKLNKRAKRQRQKLCWEKEALIAKSCSVDDNDIHRKCCWIN